MGVMQAMLPFCGTDSLMRSCLLEQCAQQEPHLQTPYIELQLVACKKPLSRLSIPVLRFGLDRKPRVSSK